MIFINIFIGNRKIELLLPNNQHPRILVFLLFYLQKMDVYGFVIL